MPLICGSIFSHYIGVKVFFAKSGTEACSCTVCVASISGAHLLPPSCTLATTIGSMLSWVRPMSSFLNTVTNILFLDDRPFFLLNNQETNQLTVEENSLLFSNCQFGRMFHNLFCVQTVSFTSSEFKVWSCWMKRLGWMYKWILLALPARKCGLYVYVYPAQRRIDFTSGRSFRDRLF